MDETLLTRIRTSGVTTLEIDTATLAAVAKGGGRLVLTKQGHPVAAIISLEDLGFVLDAEAAEQEDQLNSDEDLPSGSHRILGH